jgi:hypothetical protein
VARINAASDGSTVVVNAGTTVNIPVNVFAALKDNDIDLEINIANYTWTVNGYDIGELPQNVRNVNMRVTAVSDAGAASLTNGQEIAFLQMANNGALPFLASLTWEVGKEYAGETIYLYSYEAVTGELAFAGTAVADADGFVTLDMGYAEASLYAISAVPLIVTPPQEEVDEAPATQAPVQQMVLNEATASAYGVLQPFRTIINEDGQGYSGISIRAYGRFMGLTDAEIDAGWNAATNTATITGTHSNGSTVTVVLTQDSNTATVNGVTHDIAAYVYYLSGNHGTVYVRNIGDRLYLPLRFVSVAFGSDVHWDTETNTATITR